MSDELERLLDDRDTAERELMELEEEIRPLEEETEAWYAVFTELTAKENELMYINSCLEDYEYDE
jgi:predicted  nucleic acid-binding Zn-ribbon protein